MTTANSEFTYDNVNGVLLSLKIDGRSGSSNSRQFTIYYKNKERSRTSWHVASLIIAVLFNVFLFSFARISFTAVMIIVIVLSFLVFFWITHSVQSETLLVIPTVGIQSSVKYVCGREDNFLTWSSIDDVIINEVIKLNRVIYFLTALVKNNNTQSQGPDADPVKLVPLFKYTKPRLVMLEKIYSEMQVLLSETRLETEEAEAGAGDKG